VVLGNTQDRGNRAMKGSMRGPLDPAVFRCFTGESKLQDNGGTEDKAAYIREEGTAGAREVVRELHEFLVKGEVWVVGESQSSVAQGLV